MNLAWTIPVGFFWICPSQLSQLTVVHLRPASVPSLDSIIGRKWLNPSSFKLGRLGRGILKRRKSNNRCRLARNPVWLQWMLKAHRTLALCPIATAKDRRVGRKGQKNGGKSNALSPNHTQMKMFCGEISYLFSERTSWIKLSKKVRNWTRPFNFMKRSKSRSLAYAQVVRASQYLFPKICLIARRSLDVPVPILNSIQCCRYWVLAWMWYFGNTGDVCIQRSTLVTVCLQCFRWSFEVQYCVLNIAIKLLNKALEWIEICVHDRLHAAEGDRFSSHLRLINSQMSCWTRFHTGLQEIVPQLFISGHSTFGNMLTL